MQAWKADPQFSLFCFMCVCVCVYVREGGGREPVTACSWKFMGERIILISYHVFEAGPLNSVALCVLAYLAHELLTSLLCLTLIL